MSKIKPKNEADEQRPVSPCQGICGYANTTRCVGCFRTPEEISNWFFMNDEEKWQIIERVTPLIRAKYQK